MKISGLYNARSQNYEKRRLAPAGLSTHPSVHMEQSSSHWRDYYEVWYL